MIRSRFCGYTLRSALSAPEAGTPRFDDDATRPTRAADLEAQPGQPEPAVLDLRPPGMEGGDNLARDEPVLVRHLVDPPPPAPDRVGAIDDDGDDGHPAAQQKEA